MATESSTFVQTNYIRHCLDLNLQTYEHKASTLPTVLPSRHPFYITQLHGFKRNIITDNIKVKTFILFDSK